MYVEKNENISNCSGDFFVKSAIFDFVKFLCIDGFMCDPVHDVEIVLNPCELQRQKNT